MLFLEPNFSLDHFGLLFFIALVDLLPNDGFINFLTDVDTCKRYLDDVPIGQRDLNVSTLKIRRIAMLLQTKTKRFVISNISFFAKIIKVITINS